MVCCFYVYLRGNEVTKPPKFLPRGGLFFGEVVGAGCPKFRSKEGVSNASNLAIISDGSNCVLSCPIASSAASLFCNPVGSNCGVSLVSS